MIDRGLRMEDKNNARRARMQDEKENKQTCCLEESYRRIKGIRVELEETRSGD